MGPPALTGSIAEDPPIPAVPSERKRPRRSTIVIFLALVVAVGSGAIWFLHRSWPHPGGDPNGAILSSFRTQVNAAIPPGVTITKVYSKDAKWVSSGCDGTSGWTSPTYDVTFTSGDSQSMVIDTANAVFTSDGWKPFQAQPEPGIYKVWIRPVSDTATIALYGDHPPDLPPGTWQIGGDVPPKGQIELGC
jgi:hypothetical protein